jgi:hypothetical protein
MARSTSSIGRCIEGKLAERQRLKGGGKDTSSSTRSMKVFLMPMSGGALSPLRKTSGSIDRCPNREGSEFDILCFETIAT